MYYIHAAIVICAVECMYIATDLSSAMVTHDEYCNTIQYILPHPNCIASIKYEYLYFDDGCKSLHNFDLCEFNLVSSSIIYLNGWLLN